MKRTGKPWHRLQDRRLNESREFINKISHGYRERAPTEVEVYESLGIWSRSGQPFAAYAWLGLSLSMASDK